jgi:hypothetical protein
MLAMDFATRAGPLRRVARTVRRSVLARPPRRRVQWVCPSTAQESPMKNPGLLAWPLLAVFAIAAQAATVPVPDAHAQIEQVVAKFQTALITKDKAALESLFMPEGGAWFEVLGDDAYRQLSTGHPQVPRFHSDNHQRFIDFVVGSKGRMEEKFSNVRIETDGAIAAVYFDFVFLADGKLNNRGHEAWQLVNTGAGWKISAMAYSSEPPQLH